VKAAIYSRYSTTHQREASISDQTRNCRQRADAEGWKIVNVYADQAISGSRSDRPAYQEMLAAAATGAFGVLLLDDLSRLGRDQVESERTIRRLEFGGVRIVAVSDGYDSTSKSRKVHRGVKQLFNEELNRRGVPSPGSAWDRTVRRSRGRCRTRSALTT